MEKCPQCHKFFERVNEQQVYCTNACKQKAFRERKAELTRNARNNTGIVTSQDGLSRGELEEILGQALGRLEAQIARNVTPVTGIETLRDGLKPRSQTYLEECLEKVKNGTVEQRGFICYKRDFEQRYMDYRDGVSQ